MTEQEAIDNLRNALHDWYAAGFNGSAVLTGWYVVATGTSFDHDGDRNTNIAQNWGDTDIITQLGLIQYASARVIDRMDEGADE